MIVREEDGKITKGYGKFTDVFVKKNGKITAITTHTSPLDK